MSTIGVIFTVLSLNGMLIVDWFGTVLDNETSRKIMIAACVFGLLAAPFTHLVVGRGRYPGYSAFQPFLGGVRFVVLQALGWTLWGLFIVMLAWISFYGGRQVARGLISTA